MITIYIIYHETFENTNVFTTDINKIDELKKKLATKTYTEISEWKYKKIIEEDEFYAEFN